MLESCFFLTRQLRMIPRVVSDFVSLGNHALHDALSLGSVDVLSLHEKGGDHVVLLQNVKQLGRSRLVGTIVKSNGDFALVTVSTGPGIRGGHSVGGHRILDPNGLKHGVSADVKLLSTVLVFGSSGQIGVSVLLGGPSVKCRVRSSAPNAIDGTLFPAKVKKTKNNNTIIIENNAQSIEIIKKHNKTL